MLEYTHVRGMVQLNKRRVEVRKRNEKKMSRSFLHTMDKGTFGLSCCCCLRRLREEGRDPLILGQLGREGRSCGRTGLCIHNELLSAHEKLNVDHI